MHLGANEITVGAAGGALGYAFAVVAGGPATLVWGFAALGMLALGLNADFLVEGTFLDMEGGTAPG